MPRDKFVIKYLEWGKQYGPVTWAVVPGRKFVILNTYEAMSELLDKRGSNYIDRPVGVMVNKLIGKLVLYSVPELLSMIILFKGQTSPRGDGKGTLSGENTASSSDRLSPWTPLRESTPNFSLPVLLDTSMPFFSTQKTSFRGLKGGVTEATCIEPLLSTTLIAQDSRRDYHRAHIWSVTRRGRYRLCNRAQRTFQILQDCCNGVPRRFTPAM